MGTPAMADVDGDGIADLIAEFALFDDTKASSLRSISQKGAAWVTRSSSRPARCRGRVGPNREGTLELCRRSATEELPADASDNGIQYVPGPNGPLVVVVDGSRWIGLDPATGRVRRPPIELGFEPALPIQHVDLDGDGTIEILLLEPSKGG